MQSSFSDAEYASKKKLTRRDRFLAEIEAATPWPVLVAAGHAQPTAEALKKLALALHVTSDTPLFEEGERESDDDLKLRFEALVAMLPEEREVAKAVLDAIIVKSQVTRALERVGKPAAKEKKAVREPSKA